MLQRRLCASTGLTLVETMVTVALIGVVLAVAAPTVSEIMERQHVRGVSDEMTTDLRLARTEAVRRGQSANDVVISFGANAQLTCYVIHTALTNGAAACDCTRAPGSACQPDGVRQEIKTVQVRRSTGVALTAASPSEAALSFSPPLGVVSPADMLIDVTGNHGHALRLRPVPAGTVASCSPGGTMRGVPTC